MVTVGGTVTIILSLLVALPAEFAALTVKLNVPDAVGMPVIVPSDALRLKPGGSVPLTIDHVIGVVPVAFNVCK